MSTFASYPLHVDGSLDRPLSRWLWLVKWLLAVPHYVVLAFLWLAYAVLSVVAFFAILFTGRYPRAIFDFNVGVLRWSWRVAYYAYAALGTDRYPPFTLAEVPDYPAHVSVDYPEQLSRGLVLVKWWLLALPHYLVVGLFVGGGWYVGDAVDDGRPVLWGLIGLLVLVAAVVLLFTGRYPRSIFELVLGLNRWVLRVAAYASLMTDVYPPFRLDLGGDDPGLVVGPRPPAPAKPSGLAPATYPAAPPEQSDHRWTAGRVTALTGGSVVLVLALGIGAGGVALAVADRSQRDDGGYLMSEHAVLATGGYAIASETVDLDDNGPTGVPGAMLGDARLDVRAIDGGEIFAGIAATDDAAAYLAGVEHSILTGFFRQDPLYRQAGGGAPSVAPEDAGIWVASTTGSGTRSLTWPVSSGEWTVVVMNADAGASLAADVAVGGTVPGLTWLAGGLLAAGGVLLLVGLALVLGAALRAGAG